MIKESTWDEFRGAQLLWWVNRMLHLFGWAIVCVVENDVNGNEIVTRAYPARCKFRGFSEQNEDEGFRGLSQHLAANAATLVRDTADDAISLPPQKTNTAPSDLPLPQGWVNFIINGRLFSAPATRRYTYSDIASFAEQGDPLGPRISYRRGSQLPTYRLFPAGEVTLTDGMVFHVTCATPVQ